jgi:hypothetical protein
LIGLVRTSFKEASIRSRLTIQPVPGNQLGTYETGVHVSGLSFLKSRALTSGNEIDHEVPRRCSLVEVHVDTLNEVDVLVVARLDIVAVNDVEDDRTSESAPNVSSDSTRAKMCH